MDSFRDQDVRAQMAKTKPQKAHQMDYFIT
jgi:hypothetical protein